MSDAVIAELGREEADKTFEKPSMMVKEEAGGRMGMSTVQMKRRSLKFWGVWGLLAVLLSYSYDFECLLETHSCRQLAVISSVEIELDTGCAQPSLRPMPIALPPSPVRIQAPVATSSVRVPLYQVALECPPYPLLFSSFL